MLSIKVPWKDFLMHTNFLTMMILSLFYYYNEVFIYTNLWMTGKNSMKHHHQRNIKENFYSHLNTQDITDADYAHPKRVCKDFEMKNFGEYHDLYVQSDILLLANVFENFRNMCLEIYDLGPAKFCFSCWISITSSSKKRIKSKIRSFNWYQYVINGRKRYKRSIYITLFIDIQ